MKNQEIRHSRITQPHNKFVDEPKNFQRRSRHAMVSVITPVFNTNEFIEETLMSVSSQTYNQWEHILIDDRSNDASWSTLKRYAASDPRLKLYRNSNTFGSAATRNIAIENARGRYIAFLDSDDIWHPEKLAFQLEFIRQKKASFSFTAYRKMNCKGRISSSAVNVRPVVTYQNLLHTNDVCCSTAIYDTQKLGKIFAPDNLQARTDYVMWLDILKKTKGFGLNFPLAVYRCRKGSISNNKIRAAYYQFRFYRNFLGLNLSTCFYYFVNYAFFGFKRYLIR
jgi:glycosyltransferase involved in cell wall biosynthesis